MKMSEVFELPVTTKLKFTGDKSNELTPDVILIDGHYKLNGTECDAVEVAINNHDRLEQENAELSEALKQLVSSSEESEKQLNDLLMCNDYGESEALCKARQLLNK